MDKYALARQYLSDGKPARMVASLVGLPVAEVEGLVGGGGAVTEVEGAVSVEQLKELAQSMAPGGLRVLMEIAEDESKPAAARVAAVNAILDRGYGKAAGDIGDSGVVINVMGMEVISRLRETGYVRQESAGAIEGKFTPVTVEVGDGV